jgi:hypothetical protein
MPKSQTEKTPAKKSKNKNDLVGVWMTTGLALGAGFGLLIGNLPIGIVLGMVFGMVYGGAMAKKRNKK